MQKINFQNLPNTTTPVNATNMNQLQTNVENAINGIVEEGTWTPTINALTETAPTVTYTSHEGKYKKIGKIVFISFYIRAKITALNGTNNYAGIGGLPFTASTIGVSVGGNTANIGVLYAAVADTTNCVFVISGSNIRVHKDYGATTGKWKLTPSNYMEVGGSGFYFID